nr:unnamed protein product [Digitaria exilis]
MIDSASAIFEFNVNYEKAKHLAADKAVYSDAISTGDGHMWRIGYRAINMSEHICLTIDPLSKASSKAILEPSAKAIFEVLLIDKDGAPAVVAAARIWNFGAVKYVKDGQIKFLCTIRMLHYDSSTVPARTSGNGILVPPSDIVQHLGTLLDTADGTDLSFTIDGETFHAHRAILAARSPVFRAELLGSMAEATMASITLHDIAPATFRAMLRFIYSDALPKDDELGDSPLEEMFEHLLAAADRYALDRLKLLCAQKLWENVSVDTVGDVLACAEVYNCPELKNKCIEFVVVDNNFRHVVLTQSFMQLGLRFPSLIAEVREKAIRICRGAS